MKIGLLALCGAQVRTRRIAELGVTLPGFVSRGKLIASLPNLGLLTIAALTPKDIEVEYIEITEGAQHQINRTYDLVGISTCSAQVFEAYELADRYRQNGIRVVIGGLHATALPDEAAGHADAVVIGEGEPVWPELINDFRRDKLKQFYRAEAPFDLAKSPLPRFDFLDRNKHNRITVQTSRGCPHDCDFCAASKTLGPYRKKPIDLVVKEIKEIQKYWPHPFIEFADDNTFVDKAWSKELLKAITPLGIKWFTETDISVAEDDELLALLRPSGCHQLLVGFESILEGNLNGIDRNNWKLKRFSSYISTIKKIQSYGISLDGCFILGLEHDTKDAFRETRDFIETSGLLEAQITVMTPFPGTRLYEKLKTEKRLLKESAWDRCTLFDINFLPKNMTPEQLEEGMIWLGSQIYSEEALAGRKNHYKNIIRDIHTA
ncbi:B12-binding domain-containing radical SAM protein [Dehalogenimonas etheniformans]|uniref:Radical SAM protein n=1 Tax=Dehalogenimonas etheniformans TaxID=1536648 RepID=A0A2P5P5E3_9CHLR|nr:radical SAM protein [Dehalogenimonas etheniformans]PPD57513.1 radical SAM protein [Dehalogenimonas etheniformans]QNT76874.1 radical SAM protein [Dehalogenimonas etheniformans]